MEKKLPAFIVSAPGSSGGKTTVAIGLIRALGKRGLGARAFKAGPDYIDTGLLARASGRSAYNLDTWMMGESACKRTFYNGVEGMDAAIVEGAMGLFDGKGGLYGQGSTGHLARTLGLPVVLVLDARGVGGTITALAKGMAGFDRKIRFHGVIINRVAGERHEAIIREAFERYTDMRVLGVLPEEQGLFLPSRHLGLVTEGDVGERQWQAFIRKAETMVERHVDVAALLNTCGTSVKRPPIAGVSPRPRPRPVIAVAMDRAFCFYYRENIELLRAFGAKVAYFSPMKDERLPCDTKAVYIGGGYPEVHALALSRNTGLKREIKRFAMDDMPIYAECGGLMYLGDSIVDANGRRHEMTGVFPWTARLGTRPSAIGYREVRATKGCPFLPEGRVIRGHEHRYSGISSASGVKRTFLANGVREGYVRGNTLATYMHLHFASNPEFAATFVARAAGAKGAWT